MLLVIAFASKDHFRLRLCALVTFGYLEGLSLHPLLGEALEIQPALIQYALLVTAGIFGSFSYATLLYKRGLLRSVQMGGMIGTSLLYMVFLAFANLLLELPLITHILAYGSVFTCSAYVAYDTQLIVEKFEKGDDDHIRHALTLFFDLLIVFKRILRLLIQNNKKKQ